MQKILITGATGFIGKNLIERIKQDSNYDILCFVQDSDIIGKRFLEDRQINYITVNDFSSYTKNVDFCIHLASYGVAYGARNLDVMVDVNIKLSEQIMKFCSDHNCKLFINTGSCFEYGSGINDRLINEYDSLNPEDIYAATKVACEDLLKVYSKTLGIKMITIRPFSVFGKYENINRIGPLVINSGKNNTILELTHGEQIRDYMDVRDLCDAIYKIVLNWQNTKNGEAINICTGNPISLKEFILKIIQVFNFNESLYSFGAKQYRQNESMYFAGNNSRLFEIIGKQNYMVSNEKIYDSYKDIFENI